MCPSLTSVWRRENARWEDPYVGRSLCTKGRVREVFQHMVEVVEILLGAAGTKIMQFQVGEARRATRPHLFEKHEQGVSPLAEVDSRCCVCVMFYFVFIPCPAASAISFPFSSLFSLLWSSDSSFYFPLAFPTPVLLQGSSPLIFLLPCPC